MILHEHIERSSDLRFVPEQRREEALAALDFMRAIESGMAIEPAWAESRLSSFAAGRG